MKTRLYFAFLTFMVFGFLSCVSEPEQDPVENNVNHQENAPVVTEDTQEPEEFQVSEELYTVTFDEITIVINKLNEYIANENYEKWLSFLSNKYLNTLSDPATLADYSETPILKSNNIKLKTIDDYFQWVVVPSRSNVRLDDIVFKDENHVTAYMFIEERSIILYQLEKMGDKWKISIW